MSAHTTIKRKNKIIDAYIQVSKQFGINNVTRELIGGYAECCPSLINYYFGCMGTLLNRAAWQGVEDMDLYFIQQLISINHESTKDLKLAIVKKTRV